MKMHLRIGCKLVFTLAIVLGAASLGRADQMTITALHDGIDGMVWATGDPQTTPLTITIGDWTAKLVQDGAKLGITDIAATCTNSSGCSVTFDVYPTGTFSYASQYAVLTLDGTVQTSNQDGVSVSAGFYTTGENKLAPFGCCPG